MSQQASITSNSQSTNALPIVPPRPPTNTSPATNGQSSTASIQPTLKVMRLYKPKLHADCSTSGLVMPVALSEVSSMQNEFAMSSMLILPDSFGEIFLGNTFTSYISVINHYMCELKNVGLLASIQSGNDRIELKNSLYERIGKTPPSNPTPVLTSGESLDMIIDYPLTQVGNHVLRVGVTYNDPITNESKSLRKFYRFNVQNPLIMNTKLVPMGNTDSLIEAQVRNISKMPLYIDKIEFIPQAPYKVDSMKQVQDNECLNSVSNVDTHSMEFEDSINITCLVQSSDDVQQIFKVVYDADADPRVGLPQLQSQSLGRLQVSWKTAMGEAGTVYSQPVIRKFDIQTAVINDLTITLSQPKIGNNKEKIILGVPFQMTATIKNNTTKPMPLQLQFPLDKNSGISCSSAVWQNIGVVAGQSSKSVVVEFMPTSGGLQLVPNGKVIDLSTGREYPQSDNVQLIVHHTNHSSDPVC